jgi:hypothetical protein
MPHQPFTPAPLPLNDRRVLRWGIPLLTLLLVLLHGPGLGLRTPADWAGHAAVTLGFTTLFWLLNRALWHGLLRRLPGLAHTARRLWLLAGGAVLLTAAATALLHAALHLLLPTWFALTPATLLRGALFNLGPTAAVLTLYETVHFFQQWRTQVQRTEALARAETQAQLDALRGQLDPHFLFNNLNTLAALIEPHNEPAQHFVEQLADVYRYVLLSQGQPTVPLAEELAFVQTYLALHRTRFRHSLQLEIDIAPAALARRVAPLSLQLLVENALKHNTATREHPLHLRLTADATWLTVENTRRPRTAGLAPGTGTGLPNVQRRYELLGATQPVIIRRQESTFVVQLPLLPEPRLR